MTQLIRGRYTYLRYTQEQTGTLDRCVPISHGIPGSRRDGKTTSCRSLHSCSIHWLRFVIMQFLPSPYLSFSAIIRSYLGWETKPLETFQKLAENCSSTVICAAFHEDYHSAVSINGAMCHQPPANELVVAICITMIDL